MEFLNFLLILWAGWLIWRRPEKERLAFRLLLASCLLMALLFLIGTHTSLVIVLDFVSIMNVEQTSVNAPV